MNPFTLSPTTDVSEVERQHWLTTNLGDVDDSEYKPGSRALL